MALLVAVSACRGGSGTTAAGDASAPTVGPTAAPASATPSPSTTAGSIATTASDSAARPFELRAASEAVGTVTHGTLMSGEEERTYRLYIPSVLPAGPVPLFVGLHGGMGWGDQFAATNHVEGLAESNGFIVVHPDGVLVAGGPGGVWNGGICCGPATRRDVDDVGFVRALIDGIASEHEIDPNRVFAFGHSNGGIMSYRLACELADRIVGIGVVAGTLGVQPCEPSQPVSVMHVHGTADENVPIAGGIGPRSSVDVDFPPPRDGWAAMADVGGCPPAVTVTAGDITTDLREPCGTGAAAAFVTIDTANHAWPGGTPRVTPAPGPGYAGYDATAELVTFLMSHPRR